jgi:hypothetical protein
MKALRRRIRKLKSTLMEVQRRELSLSLALEQEEEKLNEAKEHYEALGQALDTRPQTRVHVSPVHGHKRKVSKEKSKASTRKLRQETPQAKTSRSGGRSGDAGPGVVGIDPQGCFEKIRREFAGPVFQDPDGLEARIQRRADVCKSGISSACNTCACFYECVQRKSTQQLDISQGERERD